MKCHVFVDFDGTIVPNDATDRILEAFADPSWTDVEAEWKAGKIGSRECMARQVALLSVSPEALDDYIATFAIDPAFPDFVEACRSQGFGISVLSDGLDRAIGGVLKRYGLDLAFKSNAMVYQGDGRWSLGFPHAKPACTSAAGTCKCAAAMAAAAPATVMVGDGRSDFCISNRATFVLAKSALVKHCEANNLPYAAFETFEQATAHLGAWVATQDWMNASAATFERPSRKRATN